MKLLILFLLLTQSVFAQDQSELAEKFVDTVVTDSVEKRTKRYSPKKINFDDFDDFKLQHWVAVTVGVDGVTFPTLQNTTLPSLKLSVELFLGKGFYFYSKIGTYSTLPDNKLYNNIDYGSGLTLVLGFGGYIYHNRSWNTGQGWSIMLNGGLAALGSPLRQPKPGDPVPNTIHIPIFHSIGFELNMKFNYNFLQFLGISFGPYFAYYYAYEQNSISYGITFGLII